ncbi:Tat pathway signal sequence domain protein [Streptomyces sp. NPDC005805]|uniref:Tat pathway signal sequence domain protein n=1 Tax=Streptomyces sp. NPDC005805 TaxID=3157068 RepID=UPI0033C7A595
MTSIGPVEPGENTFAADPAASFGVRARHPLAARLAALPPPRRRALLAAVCALAVATGTAVWWAGRPEPPPPEPVPWPAQAATVSYTGPAPRTPAPEPGTAAPAFTFLVGVTVRTGPPVTVERIEQTSAALWVTTSPAGPVTVRAEKPRNVLVSIHVSDCSKVARNASLPFLDVTLRNTRAIQKQSFILGDRYAGDLGKALGTACR